MVTSKEVKFLFIYMKKLIINMLCCFILFNSFMAMLSDSVYAKESFVEGVKKQYVATKENAKKNFKKLKDSGIFENGYTVGVVTSIATGVVIYTGWRLFKSFNNFNSLKTETEILSDNAADDVAGQSTKVSNVPVISAIGGFEEEEECLD